MRSFDSKNCVKGPKVSSKFKAMFLKQVWKHLLLTDRNFLSSIKNYYDVNGFLTKKQYQCLEKFYESYIDKYTESQREV